ncbi:MAG: cupin domain-containing protein [Chloroflexi bacterium]|nr:cupin domain-containing protein [Chloroflexota bacterium]
MERISERKREAEPKELLYDVSGRVGNEKVRRMAEGRVVIKGKEREWEQNRQGMVKYLLHMTDWDKVGTPGWHIFMNHIKVHSGRHTHQGGLAIFVLDGKGHTVVDGRKFEWEKDDLILLPIKPGGCAHQHFNEDPGHPAEWIAFQFRTMYEVVSVGRIQNQDHPDWAGRGATGGQIRPTPEYAGHRGGRGPWL